MSVILDALKKAQKERKDMTKNLPYNPREKSQKSRWVLYTGALLVFCVLLVFFLIPDMKKAPKIMIEVNPVHTPQPISQPVAPEKTAAVVQSTVAVNPLASEQLDRRDNITGHVKPVKTQKNIASLLSKNASGMTKSRVETLPERVWHQDEARVLISSTDFEKINLKFHKAVKETEKGNISEAKQLYHAILAEQPSNVETLNNLGVISIKEGNTEEALFYFNKVFQYNKNYGKAYNNVGLVMMKGGQKGLAEEYFRKSIELEKDDVDPVINLAALLRTEKRYEEAARLLENLLRTSVTSKPLYLSYALIKDDLGHYEQAIKYYRLYLRGSMGDSQRSDVIKRLEVLENAQSSRTH